MGRLTKGSKRTRIQDYMKKMRDTFRTALKDARATNFCINVKRKIFEPIKH